MINRVLRVFRCLFLMLKRWLEVVWCFYLDVKQVFLLKLNRGFGSFFGGDVEKVFWNFCVFLGC